MEGFLPLFLIAVVFLQTCYAPPVTNEKQKESEEVGLEDYMEYHRYLKEVISALESDADFKQKLEKAEESDIRNGKIAEELEFVSHHVRTRLDEIKRVELTRLRELTEKKLKLQKNIDDEDPTHRHLDHANPHTFEIEDLKKLISKTTEDLVEADKKRKEEFKEYEMQKEYDKQVKLNHTNGTEREKLEQEFKDKEEKHKKHEKLHEPGHKAQLEEVWQEQDQMQQEFDPRTFFMLHDIDSNGLWDQDEVKALFVKELEKMYAAGEPEDDMRERTEEMERMRETVFQEVDLNKDGFIDYQEFLAQTKRNDFQQDHGWQGLDERRPYSDQELDEYIRQHQANQIPQGYPQHPGQMPPGYHGGPPPNSGYHPNGAQVQPQFHPGQVPQYPPQQLPGHLPELNTNEVYPQQVYHQQGGFQQHPNQQQGYQQHPNQQPGYQQHPNQQAGYQQLNQPVNPQQQPNQQGGYKQQLNQPVNSQQQHPNQQAGYQQQLNQPVNSQQQPNQQAGGLQKPTAAQQNQIPVVNSPQGQNQQQVQQPKQNQQLNQNSNQGSPEVNRV